MYERHSADRRMYRVSGSVEVFVIELDKAHTAHYDV